jgi:hypothetical protein
VACVTTIAIAMSALPVAQGRRGGGNANQGLPVATNTILENPDAYYGKQLTISAGVDRMLSRTTFLLDQWHATGPKEVKPMGKPILVIAPYLTMSLDHRSYVLVRGELLRSDGTAIARKASDYKLDLEPEIWARYQGQPVLLATSVITSTFTEVARKPLSAAEVSLSNAMKTIGPTFAALRKAADDSKTDAVMQSSAMLEPAFTEAGTIFEGLGGKSAAEWARTARADAASIRSAAAAGNWAAAKTSADALGQLCQRCHAAHREPLDDGTFRIKIGSF